MMNQKKAEELLKSLRVEFPATSEESWQGIQNKIQQQPGRVVKMRPVVWWAAAASMALLIAGALWIMMGRPTDIRTITATADNAPLRFELPDGSQVWLDEGSQLVYDAAGFSKERSMSMDGTIHFDVQKSDIPFEITTDRGEIQVLGTTFTVRSDTELLEVNCFSGSVRVKNTQSTAVLTGGMTATAFSRHSEIRLSEHDFAPFISKNLEFRYEEASPATVAEDIAKVYGVRVVSEVTGRQTFSGYFSSDFTLDETLLILCKAMGIRYEKTGNEVVLMDLSEKNQ